MAAQIYSRYVPEKKKSTATPNIAPDLSSPAAIPSQATPLPATRHDASATYARYVPAPKSKKNTVAIASLSPEPASIPKRKREEVSESIQEPNPKKSKSDGVENTPKQKEKREKRKRKPVDVEGEDQEGADASAEEGDNENEDNIRHKHKSVLEKREKSLRKAEKLAEKAARKAAKLNLDATSEDAVPEEPPEVHNLGPLPQPEPVPEAAFTSSSASLLPWMATPIRVSPTTTASFSDVGVQHDATKSLQSKGFDEAFAIQAAVLPLLLPAPDQEPGDVVVSAATGSGKTLAYVLPMVQSISENKVTRLRGLIVVPTRELVNQALEVCETCAHAFSDIGRKRVKIGTAVGYQTLKSEQTALIEQELVYNPTKYEAQQRRINVKWESSDWSENESDDEDELLCVEEVPTLLDHVIEPKPKVDILICTPGRLVEHLNSTKGFSLEYVRWLVVDEADKLLDQSFQQWSTIIMSRLPLKPVRTGDRIRKVILSATMARDADQLKSLQLYRPKLVVLEGSSYGQDVDVDADSSEANILPELLIESAIKVEDDADKPLYLLHLLRSQNMISAPDADDTSSDESSSEDEDEDEDCDNDDSSSATSSSGSSSVAGPDKEQTPSTTRVSQSQSKTRGVLIFTKSNETAVRLGRLLALLDSSYKIGILTSTTRSSSRKAALKSFQAGKLSILVASDLVSRGLDLPNLAHVVNYDVPKSLTSYVHRVGRTARAGKRGHAWTLLGNTEARWFWNDIARSEVIKRSGDVTRVNINAAVSFGLEQRNKYAEALETLGREASSTKNNKGNQ